MAAIFLKLLNMSVAATPLIGAVAALRLLLRRAPKWATCILWALVAVRLVCPVSIPSSLSVFNRTEALTSSQGQVEYFRYNGHGKTPIVEFSAPRLGFGEERQRELALPVEEQPAAVSLSTAITVWAVGAGGMLFYALAGYLRLRKRVAASLPLEDGCFLCDEIDTPFVLGIVRPRIYLPSGLEQETVASVVAHERAHLARRDHWWKPLGYLMLTVHWFNPLVWLAYVLFCRDIEFACDEKAAGKLDRRGRAAYSQALLQCGVSRRRVGSCPLAFGEVGVKKRVKAVLNHRKPGFWISAMAILICGVVAVGFLTDPKSNRLPGGTYHTEQAGDTTFGAGVGFDPSDQTFSFTYDPLSSYYNAGSFTVEEGKAICKTHDGRYTYVFQILDDEHIAFVAEESSAIRMTIGEATVVDGIVFTRQEPAPASVPEAALAPVDTVFP